MMKSSQESKATQLLYRDYNSDTLWLMITMTIIVIKKKKTPTETKTSNTYNNNKAFQYFQRIHNP